MPSQKVAFSALGNIFNCLLQTLPIHQLQPRTTTRCVACAFSTTAVQQGTRRKRNKKRINDPYRAAQAQQRKSANLARQATLQQQRKAAMGDPIRSQSTLFVQSLLNPSATNSASSSPIEANTLSKGPSLDEAINFLLKPEDLSKQLAHSKWLTEPVPLAELNRVTTPEDPQRELKRRQEWEQNHENATRAVQSITSLFQGSSKDRARLNVQRCIEEFGRHNTDQVLPPKPASLGQSRTISHSQSTAVASDTGLSEAEKAAAEELAPIPKRVGPDTGSSEVQIAILTAKINLLATSLGKKDKHNKRNLRLLVHRRQKLLNYLRRKERGGPRWQHLVEKLGINDAMWKGEISI